VVLGHGLSAVQDQGLDYYASVFAEAGIAALTFDYRGFGLSDGEPRQIADIKAQQEDWRAAVAYARSRPEVDADRVAIWGTSFSGGLVLSVAADDHRLGAVICQSARIDLAKGPAGGVSRSDARRALWAALRDELALRTGRAPHYVAVTGPPGTTRFLPQPGAHEDFAAITPPGSTWRNEVAARVLLRAYFDRPGKRVGEITCPVLYCIADDDLIARPGPMWEAAEHTPRSEVKNYPCGHFDVYVDPWREKLVADQIDFLKRRLVAVTASEETPDRV
jgi:pimeloyl-ACP methyl ester carboxylesterase